MTFTKLDHLGLIGFSGDDARAFLHSQLSCDVEGLQPDRSTYGSYCTPKGRILATFLLWRTEAGFMMQLPSSLREPIQKQLSKYILRAKVKAADGSDAFRRIGIAGQGGEDIVKRMFGSLPSALHVVRNAEGATLIRLPLDRFEIVVPAGQSAPVLDAVGHEAAPAGQEAWDGLDIRAGIPAITPATQEEFVPQMVNLDLIGGVSFTKGCYPGQEIVARMHYLGRLKQRMYLAHIGCDAPPQPADKLYSADMGEQSSGMIVNAAPAAHGGYDALAVMQISTIEGGHPVHWRTPDGPTLAFLPLPYSV